MQEILRPHVQSELGMNIDKPLHIDTVRLTDVHDDYFTVITEKNGNVHHLPFHGVTGYGVRPCLLFTNRVAWVRLQLMARPLRIEFPGAIYHVMSRGNARRRIFHDDRDHERLLEGLEQTVRRCGWELFSFVLMPNHLHLFLRTPQPNLSRGMQYLLSGYANWYAKRHRRTGH